MRGKWVDAGPATFPPERGAGYRRYDWTGPAELGGVEVPFYCRDDEAPRKFLCGPVFELWRGEESRFLEDCCLAGAQVLSRLEAAVNALALASDREDEGERQPPPPPEVYLYYRSLFRNRSVGRFAVRRCF